MDELPVTTITNYFGKREFERINLIKYSIGVLFNKLLF